MENKSDCIYPKCFECRLLDCVMEYPQKRIKYWKNPEKYREASRRYRERKRVLQGKKTMKEIQLERQNKIYEFIVQYTQENLYPPTSVEIQNRFSIRSNSDVSRDLHRLQDRGLIKIKKGMRAYSLIGYKLIKENPEEER